MKTSKNYKKGFTLIELMVAMAIVAALIGMSIYGITLVQRSERNTERRTALNNINLAVRNYQIDNGVYPTPAALTIVGSDVSISGVSVVTLKGVQVRGGATNQSKYCYGMDANGEYVLGVNIEGSNPFYLKSSDTVVNCTPTAV